MPTPAMDSVAVADVEAEEAVVAGLLVAIVTAEQALRTIYIHQSIQSKH